jgi:transcriptional regulator with XRE-family HTH domain
MQHGIRAYKKGCRCDVCRKANALSTNKYRIYGKTSTGIERSRAHVQSLIEGGMTQPHIAKQAGVSISTINRLLYPQLGLTRILKASEQKVLSVSLDPSPNDAVDAIPAQRRVRALMAIGWTQKQMSRDSGISSALLNRLASGRKTMIRRHSDQKISALYDELSMIPGPNDRIRLYAMRKRWLPPLAWDDIDDLRERPRWHGNVAYEYTRGMQRREAKKMERQSA